MEHIGRGLHVLLSRLQPRLVLCKIVFDAGGTTVLLEQTLGHRRYLCDTGDELYVCEMHEFLVDVMSKGGMEIWHFAVRVRP